MELGLLKIHGDSCGEKKDTLDSIPEILVEF